MATPAKPIPDGYNSVTPYLIVDGAARAIAFYQQAFGAAELMRIGGPDGKVGHAELRIGDSRIMLADEHHDTNARGPKSFGGSPVGLLLYVENVDAVVGRAAEAGATIRHAVEDKFYGDRSGTVVDPFGHVWHVATHKEDLSSDEIRHRAEQFMKQHAQA